MFLFLILCFAIPMSALSEQDLPLIKVGHVGHDHQIALYVAVEEGRSLEKQYGVYFKELKSQEVYELYDKGKAVARVHIVRVGGGSKMPAALEQGHIDVGLGGIGPIVKFIDKGSPIKILAPLNNDGDSMLIRPSFPASSWSDFIREVKRSEKPVKIGYKNPMANAYMIFIRALKEEGIRYGQEPLDKDGKPVQVLTVNLQGEENALPALESGIVDGVVENEPMPSLLVHKGVARKMADLSDLPPKGKWADHPCCVVAATEAAIREKGLIIKALLKAIAAGGDIIARDKAKALAAETAWTRTPQEVGRMSIMNVKYVVRPDEAWRRGVNIWVDMMISSKQFQQKLKDKTAAEVTAAILNPGPLNEALSELRLTSGKAGKK